MADEIKIVAREIRERSESELEALLNGKREELHKMSFKHKLGQLRETHDLKRLKKDVARIETVLAEKRLAVAGA